MSENGFPEEVGWFRVPLPFYEFNALITIGEGCMQRISEHARDIAMLDAVWRLRSLDDNGLAEMTIEHEKFVLKLRQMKVGQCYSEEHRGSSPAVWASGDYLALVNWLPLFEETSRRAFIEAIPLNETDKTILWLGLDPIKWFG